MGSEKPHIGFIIQGLEDGHKADDADVLKGFTWSLSTLLKLTGLVHRAFVSVENPDMIYQMSGWNSVEEHYDSVHNSEAFEPLFDIFGGVLSVKASYHTTVPYDTIPADVRYITLLRFIVPPSRQDAFHAALKPWLAALKAAHGVPDGCQGTRVDGGWDDQYQVDDMPRFRPDLVGRFEDEADEAEEYNVLLPWKAEAEWKAGLDAKALSPVLENVVSLECQRLHLMNYELPK